MYGSEPIYELLRVFNVPAGLIYQTNYWINKLFHGFNFNIQEILKADSISLRYQEKGENNSSNEYRPINVGFGITYIPKAQRQIGELLAFVANAGIQIIVETHSDHILNGIRIAVKDKKVSTDAMQVLFFDREHVSGAFNTNVYAPAILDDGSLDYWPEGFFDEWDNALTELL